MDESSPAAGARIRRFLAKPAREKLESVRYRLRALFSRRSTTIRLPFGGKWALEESALDDQLRSGAFERAETRFVEGILRPGMTALDIGAHHGYYTLLASMLVGSQGRVIAFEPSPRERIRLERHIRLNNCANVRVEQIALGASPGRAELFLVEGVEDYCNSLRPPAVNAETRRVSVEVSTLDEFLSRTGLGDVDFIKLDVEGAELDVLKGASNLLGRSSRPVFMIEVYDVRTQPWGYRALEIVRFLKKADYQWFELQGDGAPLFIESDRESYDANLIAVPIERVDEFAGSVKAD